MDLRQSDAARMNSVCTGSTQYSITSKRRFSMFTSRVGRRSWSLRNRVPCVEEQRLRRLKTLSPSLHPAELPCFVLEGWKSTLKIWRLFQAVSSTKTTSFLQKKKTNQSQSQDPNFFFFLIQSRNSRD
jgi:hypothetical protein